MNMSFGGVNEYSQAAADEVAQSQQVYGIAMIASAGNEGTYIENVFSANQPGVIGVGSNDDGNTRSAFSTRGPHVDIMAPGHYVLGARRNADGGGYVFVKGTSFSAPTVAGCVALMYDKGLSLSQVRSRLFTHANDMGPAGYDTATGHGYMNCRRSLDPN